MTADQAATEAAPPAVPEITPDWLAGVLHLGPGSIAKTEIVRSLERFVSDVATVAVEYRASAPDLPRSFFVKRSKRTWTNKFRIDAEREALFYTQIAPQMDPALTVRCFHAECDAAAGTFCLVLENLAESHSSVENLFPPTMDLCLMAAECLGRVHAAWWNRPEMAGYVRPASAPEELDAHANENRRIAADFLSMVGDRITARQRKILEDLPETIPRVFRRMLERRPLTLVHGDAHFGNCLYPRRGGGTALLIDWASYSRAVGSFDLATMIAMSISRSRRNRVEGPLLRRYLEGLRAGGVRDYGEEDLQADYRDAVAASLALPVAQWMAGVTGVFWFAHLEHLLDAWEDLGCERV